MIKFKLSPLGQDLSTSIENDFTIFLKQTDKLFKDFPFHSLFHMLINAIGLSLSLIYWVKDISSSSMAWIRYIVKFICLGHVIISKVDSSSCFQGRNFSHPVSMFCNSLFDFFGIFTAYKSKFKTFLSFGRSNFIYLFLIIAHHSVQQVILLKTGILGTCHI